MYINLLYILIGCQKWLGVHEFELETPPMNEHTNRMPTNVPTGHVVTSAHQLIFKPHNIFSQGPTTSERRLSHGGPSETQRKVVEPCRASTFFKIDSKEYSTRIFSKYSRLLWHLEDSPRGPEVKVTKPYEVYSHFSRNFEANALVQLELGSEQQILGSSPNVMYCHVFAIILLR